MSELAVVSRERHAGSTWQRPTNYFFAARDAVATLVSQEVPRAMMCMGVGFMESAGSYTPVAVQSLKQGQNKFVSRDGNWLGDYVPAVYRAYPFRLGRNPDGVEMLCVNETAAQVGDSSKEGEPFFMPDGAPAKPIAEAFKLLMEIEKDRKNTQKACDALTRHNLLEPWPLKAQDGAEVLEASGLYRIAEAKLYELEPVALAEVRDSGGLMLAFGQLFSMQQVHMLGKVGIPNRAAQQAPTVNLAEENGIISFANL